MAGPNGLAIAADDTLYEADFFRGTVTRVTPSGAVSPYASGFSGPAGLAFDQAGDLLVANYNGNTLEKVPPGGGSHTTLASGFDRPVWPAVDSHGTIYLADYSNNRIVKVAADGTVTPFASISGVNAIALDPQNNLWICTWGGTVAKLTPDGQQTAIAHGLATACGIAWCPNYLAVVTYGGEKTHSGQLELVDFSGHTDVVATGLDRASSVIFDSHLNLYTADCGDTALRKFALQ